MKNYPKRSRKKFRYKLEDYTRRELEAYKRELGKKYKECSTKKNTDSIGRIMTKGYLTCLSNLYEKTRRLLAEKFTKR